MVQVATTGSDIQVLGSPASPVLVGTTSGTPPAIDYDITFTTSTPNIIQGSVITIKAAGFQATFYVYISGGSNDVSCYWENAPGDSPIGTSIPSGANIYYQDFFVLMSKSLQLTRGQAVYLLSPTCSLHCTVVSVVTSVFYILSWDGTTGDSGLGTYTGGVPVLIAGTSQATFTPQKFFVFQGQVWCRGTDGQFYQYGGASNLSFDSSEAIVTTPWLDLGKPTVRKTSESVDYAVQGQWTVSASMDFNGVYNASDNLVQVAQSTSGPTSLLQGSFQYGSQDWTADGYHVQFQATSTDPTPSGAILSEIVFNFQENEPK